MRVLIDRVGDPALAAGGELDDEVLARLYTPPASSWLRVNMVSTVDGAATGASGRTGSINNAADKRVFDLLRRQADAIVVGAGTARTEGYRPTDRPTVVVSGRAEVPERLRGAPAGSVLLVTGADAAGLADARGVLGAEHVIVLGARGSGVELARLRPALSDRGLRSVLCEGGPSLLGDLLRAGVVDELCATVVPVLVGGGYPRIARGGPVDVPLDLRLLLEQDGTLLGRWQVGGGERG